MGGQDEARARAVLIAMQERLAGDPYVALGVSPTATPAEIRAAFLQLTKTYHPARFGYMSAELQKLSNEVFLALRAAHDWIARPARAAADARADRSGTFPRADRSGGYPVVVASPRADRSGGYPVVVAPQRTDRSGAYPAVVAPQKADRSGAYPAVAVPQRTDRSGAYPAVAAPPRTDRSGAVPVPIAHTPSGPLRAAPGAPSAPAQGTQTARLRAPVLTPAMGVPRLPATPPAAVGSGAMRPASRTTGAVPIVPARPDDRELAGVIELLQRGQWEAARAALSALVARAPNVPRYLALLSYARGREAQLAHRLDEARVELQAALQLDPELQLAKTALAELFTRRK